MQFGKLIMDDKKPMAVAFPFYRAGLFALSAAMRVSLPLLSAVTVVQADPLLPANTDTTINQAANGVPIVNIAKPNDKGLSHNRYTQFNVGQPGLIFNNSAQPVNTQLGGYIPGNAQAAQPANLILNEIISATPSQLKGYMEVAGQKAGVVVANPWGISCDGCGFINTNHATLATGNPLFDSHGQLSGFAMGQGNLTLEGQGLNASNIDRAAFYTRALLLNAELHARDLTIATGIGELDLEGNALSSSAALGTAPEFSIDSSALGGMYANRIRLIGTEAGVGVRLGAPIAALTGQITISANGDLRLADTSAATHLSIKGNRITPTGQLVAGGNLSLEANEALALNQRIEAQGHIQLNAPTLYIADNNVVAAQQQITVQADSLRNHGLLYGRTGIKLILEDWLENGIAESVNDASQYRFTALLSDGDIVIANAAGNRLARVSNYGSLIESREGQITIKAQQLDNLNIGWALAPVYDTIDIIYSSHEAAWDSYNHGYGSEFEKVYRYKTTTQHHDVSNRGMAAQIVSQGDMWLSAATLNNDASLISSLSTLTLTVDTIINNIDHSVNDRVSAVTEARYWDCYHDSWGNKKCTGARTLKSDPIIQEDSVLDSRPDQLIPAAIESQDQVIITTSALVNGNPVTEAITVAGVDFGQRTDSPFDERFLGALFHKTPPGHPYLIETDPAINTYQGFLGSAYLLSQLDWSPEITQKRLGDSYYELSLIRESLLAQTGSRFLDPAIADEKAQFETLMQNAIAASESLQLSPGIALSREQIDALQQDMVWLESRFVGDEEVLVPVVYLAQGSPRLLTNGAIIGGGNLMIEADTVSNSGLLNATNTMSISTIGNIHNKSGQLKAGDDLIVQSGGDILNESGHISGHNVILLAKGDISHITTSETASYGNRQFNNSETRIGETASVTATGEQTQVAGGNLTLQAANISGNNVSLAAGNHLILSTVEKRSSQQVNTTDWRRLEEDIYHLQTQVEAAQNLSLQAGGNLVAIAATLEAGGAGHLSAGGDILMQAAVNEQSYSEVRQQKNAVRQKTTSQGSITQTTSASTFTTGGDLSVNAGGDITVLGSSLAAGNTLRIGGEAMATARLDGQSETSSLPANLKVGTITLTNESWYETERSLRGPVAAIAKGLAFAVPGLTLLGGGLLDIPVLTSSSQSSQRTTNHQKSGSTLSGKDIDIQVADTALFVGATASATHRLNISAGNILIDATAESTNTQQSSRQKNALRGKQHDTLDNSTINWHGSSFNAEQITLQAEQDIKIRASSLTATDSATLIAGGAVDLLSATEGSTTTRDRSKKGGLVFQASQSSTQSTTAKVTTITAGEGGLVVHSKGDIALEGSHLRSGAGISLVSEEGQVLLKAVQDTLTQESTRSRDNGLIASQSRDYTHTETVHMVQMESVAAPIIRAAAGIQVELKQGAKVSNNDVEAVLTALKQEPGLEWLAELDATGKLDYKLIQEVAEQQHDSSRQLGKVASIAVAVAVTVVTGGAAGTVGVALIDGAIAAGVSSAAVLGTQAVLNSAINGDGLGGIKDRLVTSDVGKSLLTAMVTGGLTASLSQTLFGISTTTPSTNPATLPPASGFQLDTWSGISKQLAYNLTMTGTGALVDSAINGTDLKDGLTQALRGGIGNTIGAVGFYNGANFASSLNLPEGSVGRALMHAATGAATGKLINDDAAGGAAGAFVASLFAPGIGSLTNNNSYALALGEIAGTLGAVALTGNLDSAETGQATGRLVTQYNYLSHKEADALTDELAKCQSRDCEDEEENGILARYRAISNQNEKNMAAACINLQSSACQHHIRAATEGASALPREALGWNALTNQSTAVQRQAQQVQGLMNLENWRKDNCAGLSDSACDQKLANADQVTKDSLRLSLDALQMVPGAGNVLGASESLYTLLTGMDFTDQEASRLMAMANIVTMGVGNNVAKAGKMVDAVQDAKGAARAGESLTKTGTKGSSLPAPQPAVASNGLVYQSNPKHTPGQPSNRPNAGTEPQNSIDLFGQSIPSSKTYGNKKVTFAADEHGNVHRFEGTNGVFHWSGSTGDTKNPLQNFQIPNDVQKTLGVRVK